MLKIIPLIFIVSLSANDFDTDALSERAQVFFAADTTKARAQISTFTDEELVQITQEFKKTHSKVDQRAFWLIEEHYRRNAERVAAERIRYLFMAVVAALGIIAAFSIVTYRKSNS